MHVPSTMIEYGTSPLKMTITSRSKAITLGIENVENFGMLEFSKSNLLVHTSVYKSSIQVISQQVSFEIFKSHM